MDILKRLYMEHKDDDDDDDVSFAKWMSSFWGHSWIEEDERGLRDRRGSQDASYRKSSLPCPVSCTMEPGENQTRGGGFLFDFFEGPMIQFSLVEMSTSKPFFILTKIPFIILSCPPKDLIFIY